MTITRHSERRRKVRRTAVTALVASLLAHLIAVVVAPHLVEAPPEPEPPEQPLEVIAQYEEEAAEEAESAEVAEAVEAPAVEAQPAPVVEAPAEPEKFSAEHHDNAASQEVASIQPPPAPELPPPPTPSEPAPSEAGEPASNERYEETLDEQSSVVLRKPNPDARAVLMPTMESYDQAIAQRDDALRERAKELGKGDRLFADYEKNSEGLRESLTSFGHAVNHGNHTGVDPHSKAYGSYVGMIHSKIHMRWADSYLTELDLREPPGSPLNDPELNTKLEFVIRAADGEVEKVNIVRSSGQLRFDAQAVTISRGIGPHPGAPEELVSPDGRVYIHWNFWRDQRQCGLFGASVFIVNG